MLCETLALSFLALLLLPLRYGVPIVLVSLVLVYFLVL